ncbi:MAG: hypothetical protein SW833_02660, partial [Cyanobacteriota bacterium]|nr:hypothetical protein [Cyanobacteriota bacterium]
ETLRLGARLKRFEEMSFEGGVPYSQLEKDRLYGTKLKLTGVYTYEDGSTETRKQELYLYRWLEVVAGQDASVATGRTAAFHEKVDGGLGKFVKNKEVDLRLPVSVATKFQGEKSEFVYGGELSGSQTAQWDFQKDLPVVEKGEFGDVLEISADGVLIGQLLNQGSPPKLVQVDPDMETQDLDLEDDDSTFATDLGFNFNFFSNNYSQFHVNNNGNVSFGSPYIGYPRLVASNFSENGVVAQNPDIPMIAPFWSDVDTKHWGKVKLTKGTELMDNTFVQIDWSEVLPYTEGFPDLGIEGIPDLGNSNSFSLYLTKDASGGDWFAFSYYEMKWARADSIAGKGADKISVDGLLVDPITGFPPVSSVAGFSNGNNLTHWYGAISPVELLVLQNQHFLFRVGENGQPELMLGYDAESKSNPMKKELGLIRYFPEIYTVVEAYNKYLVQLERDGRITKKPETPLDWKWIAAMMMVESNPEGIYEKSRRYDPLQTSNDEGIASSGRPNSILGTVKGGYQHTDTLAMGTFRDTIQQIEETPLINGSWDYKEDSKRINAKMGIELGVIGLLYKSVRTGEGSPIAEWRSWFDGTTNYNGGGNPNYASDVQTEYEAFEGWWSGRDEPPLSWAKYGG